MTDDADDEALEDDNGLTSHITLFGDDDNEPEESASGEQSVEAEEKKKPKAITNPLFRPRTLDPVKPINKWLTTLSKLEPSLRNYSNRETSEVFTVGKKQEAKLWLDFVSRLREGFSELLAQDGLVPVGMSESDLSEKIAVFLECCEIDENRLVLESAPVTTPAKQAQQATIILLSNLSPAHSQLEEKKQVILKRSSVNIFDPKVPKHFIVLKVKDLSLRPEKLEEAQATFDHLITLSTAGGGGAISAICNTLGNAEQYIAYCKSGSFTVYDETEDCDITYFKDEKTPKLYHSQHSEVDARKPPVQFDKVNNLAREIWGLSCDIDEVHIDPNYEGDILIVEKNAAGNPFEGVPKHGLGSPFTEIYAVYFANHPGQLVAVLNGVIQMVEKQDAEEENKGKDAKEDEQN